MRSNAMGLDRKSGIRDPASRIRCRTGVSIIVLGPLHFSLFISDITSVIVSCRYHLYADDVQLYISCRPSDNVDCISRLNLDFDHTLQYGHCNTASQSTRPKLGQKKAMVVRPRLLQLYDTCQISLDGNTIDLHQKVKKLELIMNSKPTWDDQILNKTDTFSSH
jgi:hypothetical protein